MISHLNGISRLNRAGAAIKKLLSKAAYTTNAVTEPFKEDIPIAIVSHAVNKAYVVNPMSSLPHVLDKYCWLTKTSIVGDIPENFSYDNVPIETVDNFKNFLIQQSKRKVISKEHHYISDDTLHHGIMYGLFQLGLSELKTKADSANFYLDSSPEMRTHWMRSFDYFQLKCIPSLVLRRSSPTVELPVNFSADDSELRKPGPFNTYSLNLYRHGTVKLQNFPGYFRSDVCPYPFVSTLFLSTRSLTRPCDLLAGSIVTTFGHLVSEALVRGELFGTQMETPPVAFCVTTDGMNIAFVAYKLNTLSLQDDRGTWNHAWTAGPFPLLGKEASDTNVALNLSFVNYFMNVLKHSTN